MKIMNLAKYVFYDEAKLQFQFYAFTTETQNTRTKKKIKIKRKPRDKFESNHKFLNSAFFVR